MDPDHLARSLVLLDTNDLESDGNVSTDGTPLIEMKSRRKNLDFCPTSRSEVVWISWTLGARAGAAIAEVATPPPIGALIPDE